jgi:hypothetical protein
MPDTRLGDWIGLVYGLPAVLLFYFGYTTEGSARPWFPGGGVETLALAYFWLIVACSLRQ